jgi:succinoglycan biosynthesis protein ExoA
LPLVSVIVPCYNEEKTIGLLLEAVQQQEYLCSDMEVIIADGLSTDLTRQKIQTFQDENPDLHIRIVDNPQRNIPSGLNRALDAAQGEFIVRLDAHCMPQKDYIRLCVEGLQTGSGENVGGVWEIHPGAKGWIAEAIAAAASHPLGVGDARYRYTTQSGWVDTVPFGAFRKEIFQQYGKFDENLLTNEDYEYNARLRKQGGRVYLDVRIRSIYFARATLKDLARQYWRYGFWKWRMLKKYPGTIRWRQALPPLFVSGILVLLLLSVIWPIAFWLLTAGLITYLLALAAASVQVALKEKKGALLAGIPLAVATMHVCWGAGFLWSMFKR